MTQWIDSVEGIERVWTLTASSPVVSIDTESDQMHAYRPGLCLLQIATATHEFVVDPLAIPRESLEGLGHLLSDPQVTKIMHAADNDMRLLQRQYGFKINNIFDTQEAARFLGEPKTGLASVLDLYLGVAHHKRFQQIDWKRRPLPHGAFEYAIMDVRHLIALREVMTDALQAKGWLDAFHETCRALESKDYGDGSVGWGRSGGFDQERFRKLRGAKGLGGRGRAILKGLFIWRHERCEEENRSALMLMEDSVLVEVARVRPKTMDALASIRGMSNRQLRRYGDAVLGVVEAAMEADIPSARGPRNAHRWDGGAELDGALLSRLMSWRVDEARRDNLEGALVAPRKILERLAKAKPADLQQLTAACSSDWLNWQINRYGERALSIINAPSR
jgi:ribonuclease D